MNSLEKFEKKPQKKVPKTQTEKFEHLERINPNLRILVEKFDLLIKL